VWNAFVDLLALEDYAHLSPTQRVAHLVFSYESEVQNGGHGQFFANQGAQRIPETVASLRALGLSCHAQVLEGAARLIDTGTLAAADRSFHACTPTIIQALQKHLAETTADYVELV
jgi:hypothetical protein